MLVLPLLYISAHPAHAGNMPAPDSDSDSKDSDDKSSKKKSGSTTGEEFGKRKLGGGWWWQPYVTPGGGVQVYTSDGATVTSGIAQIDAGIKHWKKEIKGDLGVGASYTTGDALNGFDVHGGETIGYRAKYFGVSIGGVAFYNQYDYADGTEALAPSLGVEAPIELTAGPSKYYVFGGGTPAWLFNEQRHSAELPFMDEFEWQVGAGVNFKSFDAELSYVSRTTAAGTVSQPTLTVTWAP